MSHVLEGGGAMSVEPVLWRYATSAKSTKIQRSVELQVASIVSVKEDGMPKSNQEWGIVSLAPSAIIAQAGRQ